MSLWLRLSLTMKKTGQLFKKALLFIVKTTFSEMIRQAIKKWLENLFQ